MPAGGDTFLDEEQSIAPLFGLTSKGKNPSLAADIRVRASGGRGHQGSFTPELRPSSLLGRFGSTNNDSPLAKLGQASVLPWVVMTGGFEGRAISR